MFRAQFWNVWKRNAAINNDYDNSGRNGACGDSGSLFWNAAALPHTSTAICIVWYVIVLVLVALCWSRWNRWNRTEHVSFAFPVCSYKPIGELAKRRLDWHTIQPRFVPKGVCKAKSERFFPARLKLPTLNPCSSTSSPTEFHFTEQCWA